MKTYTCDKCGKEISRYGLGYVRDASLVNVHVSVPERESGLSDTYHLHHKCYVEMTAGFKND